MGNLLLCATQESKPIRKIKTTKNQAVKDDKKPPAPEDVEGEVHVLICGIDYSCDKVSWAGKIPLDTKHGFDMMVHLCEMSRCTTIKKMWNEQCTFDGVKNAIWEMSEVCGPNDYFVFYFAGHGDQLVDHDGVEADGLDEALCLVDEYGSTDTDPPSEEFRERVWMRDDEFVHELIEAFHDKNTHMVFLLDCCHSASMCDFDTDKRWKGHGINAISLCGCQDHETSAGLGKGGFFTRSLTMAIQELSNENFSEPRYYNCSEIYNKTLHHYSWNKHFSHTQNISMSNINASPSQFPWPLNPQGWYVTPANTHLRGVKFDGDGEGKGEVEEADETESEEDEEGDEE